MCISQGFCPPLKLKIKNSLQLKHPYWAVRLTKICDNSQSDYLPSISRLVTYATRLTLNSINPDMLEIMLIH